MTVVPLAFQLCSWIPAWWRGAAGGDDLVGLVGADVLPDLSDLRERTVAVTAFCPELGVAALPGPKVVTEAAVAAGEAVILHPAPGTPSTLLIPSGRDWAVHAGNPARPVDLDPLQADAEMAQAVVAAEQELREAGAAFGIPPRAATARPLPPDAGPDRRGRLVRAVRLWTAVAAVPASRRSPALDQVLRAAARATLAAYADPRLIPAGRRASHDRRLA
jgi:hypothetical protein